MFLLFHPPRYCSFVSFPPLCVKFAVCVRACVCVCVCVCVSLQVPRQQIFKVHLMV